jgi:hypothetical protein
VINTFEDLHRDYPEDRHDMSEEREREFITHCYRLYKQEGFSKTFWTPHEATEEHIGKTFEVLEEIWDPVFDIECLPAWRIRLEDGEEIEAFSEEIVLSDMKANGYKF